MLKAIVYQCIFFNQSEELRGIRQTTKGYALEWHRQIKRWSLIQCWSFYKGDKTLRLCIDYASLSKTTVKGKYLLPHIQDTLGMSFRVTSTLG